jgi:hypothetical protein
VSIVVFVAIIAVVAWLIYRGMQRQNTRFGSLSHPPQVEVVPSRQWDEWTVSNEATDAVPLYVKFQQEYCGERDKIVQTLSDVADMLQKEVDVRIFPSAPAADD